MMGDLLSAKDNNRTAGGTSMGQMKPNGFR